MSQEQKKRPQSAKKARQSPNRIPQSERFQRTGAKTAVEIVVSLALVALVGVEGYQVYHKMVPIAQDVEVLPANPSENGGTQEPTTEPTVYENVAVDNTEIHAGDLILVNRDNAYEEQNSTEIVSIYEHKTDSYHVSGSETSLREPAIEALNQMLDDFYVATGHKDIIVISGYRTNEQQQALYDDDLEQTGESTSTRVALPGHSEHETGYSLDLSLYFDDGTTGDYDGTGDYTWIDENCAHYGYILRYTEEKSSVTGIQAEPWHYRYVGQPHATYMEENNVCLEEYLTLLKNYTSDNPLQIVNWDGEIYQVYYVAADAAANSTYVLAPPDLKYTISGNNSDGFLVTVDTGEIQKFEETSSEEPAAGTDTQEETVPDETTENAG